LAGFEVSLLGRFSGVPRGERQGRASLLQPERDRGQADHRQHSGAVISATAAARFSKLSFAALVIALLWWQW
jgi:hypothetical protein